MSDNQELMSGNQQYNRQLRNLTLGATVTLLTTIILVIYLLPFGYMMTTSVKSRSQIARNKVLPMTQDKWTYEGENLPAYRVSSGDSFDVVTVPTDDGELVAGIVQEDTETGEFVLLDVYNSQIIRWDGTADQFGQAERPSVYRYRGEAIEDINLLKSKDYAVYEVEIDGESRVVGLVQTPNAIMIDTETFEIIRLDEDPTQTLVRAPQISEYQYQGEDNPDAGLENRGRYPVYVSPDDVDVHWALSQVNSDDTLTFASFNAETDEFIEVVNWDGQLAELAPVLEQQVMRYMGDDNEEFGLARRSEYRVFILEDGTVAAFIGEKDGQGVFVEASNDEGEPFLASTDGMTPFWEPAQWRQTATEDRANGLRTNEFYPVYISPEGDANWALVRPGTYTDETVFFDASDEEEREREIIRTVVDVDSLEPITEPFTEYTHFGSPLPEWSLAAGDVLPLYFAENGEDQWALVQGYLPASGKATVFIDPDNVEAGVFTWNERYYETLGAIEYWDPQWGNFNEAWNTINFPRLMFNTFAIAFIGLFGTLISSVIVAYGFSRFRIPYKNVIFLVLIGTIVLPRQVTLVPTYAFFERIGWTNTWLPLIVPHFFANAYNVFLLRQFIQTIPRAMDEAAMLDGAGPLRILWSIILPQAFPALVAAGLFHVVFAWNDYFEPLIYTLGSPDIQPISVGIQRFNFIYNERPEFIQATSLMALVLPVLIFFFAQRYFMQGVVVTGVDK